MPMRNLGSRLLLGAFFVLVVWFGYGFLLLHVGMKLPDLAAIGDAFGPLNALFSGVALVGVVVALTLQMQELALQREEMQSSRAELQRTADAQSQQVALLAQQIEAMSLANDLAATRRKHEITPVFELLDVDNSPGVAKLTFGNSGGVARDLRVKPGKIRPDTMSIGGKAFVNLDVERPGEALEFNLTCFDQDGNERTFEFEVDPWHAEGRKFRYREVGFQSPRPPNAPSA